MYNIGTHTSIATEADITIRLARSGDEAALRALAERDSRPLPAGELLVAEVDGSIRAAAPITGGGAIADPFTRSGELVTLLSERVEQLRGRGRGKGLRARFGRAAGSRSRGGVSPQPAGTVRPLD
jgi:hypothetical protein